MTSRVVDEGDLDEKEFNTCFRVNVVYSKRFTELKISLSPPSLSLDDHRVPWVFVVPKCVFRFLRDTSLDHLKGSVGLILVKDSPVWYLYFPRSIHTVLHSTPSLHSFSLHYPPS